MVDDGLGTSDVTEASPPVLEHVISGVRMESADIDIGFASEILQGAVQGLERRAWSRDCWWDSRFSGHQTVELRRQCASFRRLDHRHAVLRHHL